MKDDHCWSLLLGRWSGVSIRIHMLLILAVALMFGAEWNPGALNSNMFYGTAMATAFAFLIAVVAHQMAHVFATRSLGCDVHDVTIYPWGGSCESNMRSSGFPAAMVHGAGIFANGMLVLLGLMLLITTSDISMASVVNPLAPHRFDLSSLSVSFLKIFTWVNFQLVLINLIPCFPFDGAGIVRSLINRMQLDLSQYRVETAIMLIGHACSFALIGIGLVWMFRNFDPGIALLRPAWLYVLSMGVVLFFSARYSLMIQTEDPIDVANDFIDYEFDSIYDSSMFYEFEDADEDHSMVYSQWLNEKQAARIRQRLDLEIEEDSLADSILDKLHQNGGDLSSLTTSERSVLQRFSERVRRRREEAV